MTTLFLVVAGLCIATGIALSFVNISRSSQRRIYWAAACLAAVAGFFIGYPNIKNAIGFAAMLFATMTVMAYVATPYIKIGGKIYALTVSDRQPDPDESSTAPDSQPARDGAPPAKTTDAQANQVPDSYSGFLTPATMWWLLVGLAAIAAGNSYAYLCSDGQAAPAAVSATLAALLAVAGGYGDGSWRYRIARGQHLPFVVASVITAGGFALLYLGAYHTARRFPLRRTQSMEYHAHPRHRPREP
jgi:hypothetical protein